MPILDDLVNFDVDHAEVSLWICRGPTGPANEPTRYTARWVEVADDLASALKQIFVAERGRIEDVQEYDLLAATLDGGSLTISSDETNAPIIVNQLVAQTPAKRVRGLQDMRNAAFYVIKLVHEAQIVYAVRKTESTWRTKNAVSFRTLIFQGNELTIDDRPHFDISTSIDFFIVGDEILILQKGRFESILRYKQAHKEDFASLQAEANFSAIFVNMAPLVAHVGDNKIQLRRASAIRQKGHYANAGFMSRLRELGHHYGFNIQFAADGRIVPTPETCAEIMTALLDHRLSSAFSSRIYDVPSATVVTV